MRGYDMMATEDERRSDDCLGNKTLMRYVRFWLSLSLEEEEEEEEEAQDYIDTRIG
jgi:hypothetical protein